MFLATVNLLFFEEKPQKLSDPEWESNISRSNCRLRNPDQVDCSSVVLSLIYIGRNRDPGDEEKSYSRLRFCIRHVSRASRLEVPNYSFEIRIQGARNVGLISAGAAKRRKK
jgi:hypothetical protein